MSGSAYGATPAVVSNETGDALLAVEGGNVSRENPRPSSFSSSLRFPVAAIGALTVLFVCVSMKYAYFGSGHAPLRLEDVYTTDRCVVYTYVFGGGGGELEVWKASWSAAGWKPVVLTEEHAALHPKYQEYKDYFLTMPTTNSPEYETACYIRHMAMAAVGGGTMSDADIINVNVPPSPNCDFLPNNGALTTHENFVPSIITGDENAFNGFVDNLRNADWNAAMTTVGQTMLSDMILSAYFAMTTPPMITANALHSGLPTDAPCAEDGTALPLIWHFSHDTMMKAYGGADRPSTMNAEWERLKEAVNQCKPLPVDASTYGETFWKTKIWEQSA